ncbi:unnamed protein product [Strongylus vulgaris]|uniref:Fungal lipase-type domain-containing protein n=1 Tax=Strongylus vulgaris TaxID=40348 RepID=A0A3P7JXB3_STRVU|nr:unnamed protein product [Strongylus vulgaris]
MASDAKGALRAFERKQLTFVLMMNVNRYFLNGHLVLWPPVEKVLKDPKYAGYKLMFTGHSLGGALAALAAARTAKQGNDSKNFLSSAQSSGYKLMFTGHSLGGALAALAAARTAKQGNDSKNFLSSAQSSVILCSKLAISATYSNFLGMNRSSSAN